MKLSALLSVHPPTNSLAQSEISYEREDIKVKPLAIYKFDGDPVTVSSYKSLLGLESGPFTSKYVISSPDIAPSISGVVASSPQTDIWAWLTSKISTEPTTNSDEEESAEIYAPGDNSGKDCIIEDDKNTVILFPVFPDQCGGILQFEVGTKFSHVPSSVLALTSYSKKLISVHPLTIRFSQEPSSSEAFGLNSK